MISIFNERSQGKSLSNCTVQDSRIENLRVAHEHVTTTSWQPVSKDISFLSKAYH